MRELKRPFNASSHNALYGPSNDSWAEPDWEAMGVHETALQGLSETLSEESDE